jgi:hypothetical protein
MAVTKVEVIVGIKLLFLINKINMNNEEILC